MLYVFAWLIPPLALLLVGKPFSAIINGCFWLVGCVGVAFLGAGLLLVIPCIIHAWAAVAAYRADRRQDRLIRAMQHRN